MSSSNRSSRRDFLAEAAFLSAAAIAGTAAAQDKPAENADSLKAQPASAPADPKFPNLRVAFVATGGIAESHIKKAVEFGVKCPCYADVDTREHALPAKHWPEAKAYQDYREMFEKEHANFDAVMIGTPDHHHYPASMLALKHGKHVYTQKPLTHTPWEARQLAQLAAKTQVATQMGNQGHAGEGWRLTYEWIRGGLLGDILETHTWTDRPIWPQGMERGEDEDVPPKQVNWDVWCGPAPLRPFKRGAYHRFNWRGWWDFGAGALGDMACHTLDGVFWSLEPGSPTAIEPFAATPITGDAFSKSSIIRWEFPAREIRFNGAGGAAQTWKRPAFHAYWYDGGIKPCFPEALEIDRKLPDTGNIILGTKASLLISGDYGESPRIFPETKMKEIGKPPQLLERSPGHMYEWFAAAAGEKPLDFPKSNFAYAGPFTESILLGNVALRVGRRLIWDGEKMQFTNCESANKYVSKEYRDGWKF